jgi:hypothetical protein
MEEVYVIWPSDEASGSRGVSSLCATIKAHEAKGYVGKLHRVKDCTYIVLTSGDNRSPREHYVAKITKVTTNNRLGKYPCVDVTFGEVKPIKHTKLDSLKWSSRNVRYLLDLHADCSKLLP